MESGQSLRGTQNPFLSRISPHSRSRHCALDQLSHTDRSIETRTSGVPSVELYLVSLPLCGTVVVPRGRKAVHRTCESTSETERCPVLAAEAHRDDMTRWANRVWVSGQELVQRNEVNRYCS